MAEKKKKEIADFEMPTAEDLARINEERTGAAARVAEFNKTYVPTGSAFKNMALKSGTSRDIKMMMHADNLLSKSADRQKDTRGQDMEFTSQAGNIAMSQDRNRIMEKGGDQQFKLGEGELDFNRGIFDATQERYRKYGEASDILNLGVQAARAGVEFDEYGIELTPEMKKLREGTAGVAKPEGAAPIGEDSIFYNKIPDAVQDTTPDWLKPMDYRNYNTTGVPAIDVTLGALNEGAKSLFRPLDMTGKYLDETFGTGVARPKRKERSSLRAKVRRVN
jgi:hypothetical protein